VILALEKPEVAGSRMWAVGRLTDLGAVVLCQRDLHEICRMGRRIVMIKLICSLGHCVCDGHTVHKLSQRRLTADWLALRESDYSRMHSKVSSDWLPSYTKTTGPVLEIFKNGRILTGQASYVSYSTKDTTPKSIFKNIYSHVCVLPLERCTPGKPLWVLIFMVANES